MAVSISGSTNTTVYGKGDICLKLNPFDNYRMFTLYEDWTSDDKKPIDLSNDQKIYLVFQSGNKEIRISEYDTSTSAFTVDKVNGQVLFNIDQKNAIDILAMDNHTFYITRVYEVTDMTGDNVVSSDEEVIYTGQWKDESSNTVEDYTSQIKTLNDLLEDRNATIKSLQESLAQLMEQNVNLSSQVEEYKEANDTLTSEISDLESKIADYESGTVYDGTVVGEGTNYTIISGRTYTEEEMSNVVKSLETTVVE